MVHVANSGRLRELLKPEHTMLVAPAPPGTSRKTDYDLALVDVDGVMVSADARLPNGLLEGAIEADQLPEFAGYDRIQREVPLHDSRIDLMLSGPRGRLYVEAKSVTLEEDGVGLFPDAPTDRGRKHLLCLERAVREGHRAAVVFVIQREDVRSFSPNIPADPRFAETLQHAVGAGLEAYAYRCNVTRNGVNLSDAVPVRLT